MNRVCSSVIAIVNVIALVEPMNNERNDPTQVGHAIKSPVVAPILPIPPVFLVIEMALTARVVLSATR